jgi:hypothetical protein
MPKRTNDFQKLVDIIQRLYAPEDATVTTSAMLTPQFGGTPREIDILVEFKTGFKVAIEAKGLSRPMDATGVETYIGKYNNNGGIIVDKVIIVAHSFSETAKQRAKNLGFSLHTINELEGGIKGLFSKDETKAGCWLVTKELGKKRVNVTLFSRQGSVVPLSSIITPRTSKIDLGRAIEWVQRLLKYSVGKIVYEQCAKYAGTMIRVIVEVPFSNYKARFGKNVVNLRKMVFDFERMMQIPPTHAQQFELKTDSEDKKTIVRETGIGTEDEVTMVYEKKNNEHPQKFYLDHKSLDGTPPKGKTIKIVMKL